MAYENGKKHVSHVHMCSIITMWPYKVTCTHTHFPLYQVYIIKFLVKCRLCIFCSLIRFDTSWLWCKMTKCTFNIIIMQSQNLQNVVIKLDSLICRKWTLLIKKKSLEITVVLQNSSVPIVQPSYHSMKQELLLFLVFVFHHHILLFHDWPETTRNSVPECVHLYFNFSLPIQNVQTAGLRVYCSNWMWWE